MNHPFVFFVAAAHGLLVCAACLLALRQWDDAPAVVRALRELRAR